MSCDDVLPLLDRFEDQELPADTDAAVMAHVQGCAPCRARLERMEQLQERIRSAARGVRPPADLAARVQRTLDSDRRPAVRLWVPLAMAASILVGILLSWGWQNSGTSPKQTPEEYTAEASASLTPVMRVGFVNHLHCTIFGRNFAKQPDLQKVLAELGPRNATLYPVLANHVPAGYTVAAGHICEWKGHRYLHLVARKGESLLSLLFTRRGTGEAFEHGLRPVSARTPLPVYASTVQLFNLAGLETKDFLVFVISDLPADQNTGLLSSMATELAASANQLDL